MDTRYGCALMLSIAWTCGMARADVLTTRSIVYNKGTMVVSSGNYWGGGAGGVQGPESIIKTGAYATAGNVMLQFGVGSAADSLDSAYGEGNWTIANVKLKFQYTLYAHNTTFGSGAGNFDIFWTAKNDWASDPASAAYVTSETGLASWAGDEALLASAYYDWTTPGYAGTAADVNTAVWSTDKTGIHQSTMTIDLDADPLLVADVLGASALNNGNLTLYLMATSSTTGLIIFTGGAGLNPTLMFDVVSVPEPAGLVLLGGGMAGGLLRRSRRG